jgi:hypothetical protein
MYHGLALVISTLTFALSVAMLAPQGMWLWIAGLVVSTAMITLILPEIKHKNDD